MRELPKTYDPKQVEKKIYDMWEKNGCFRGEIDSSIWATPWTPPSRIS